MPVTVRLPAALRSASQPASVEVEARTVAEAIAPLGAATGRIVDELGVLRRHVNVFVNGDNVRFLDGLATELRDGDEVVVLPAVSGGAAP